MKIKFCLLSMIFFLSISISWAQEAPLIITNMNVEPNIVNAGGNVLISCQVTHSQGSTFINRVAATFYHGKWITQFHRLYDDATNGDIQPGDGIYSRQIKSGDIPCTARIIFHATDNDGNEIDSAPIFLTIQ